MATNDGTSAELFPGWSSVVHQPSEDPEETDLPSTVDIAALSVEPNNTEPVNGNSDSENDSEADSSNSASDASQSHSQSDSSDSEDSSTSSQESSSRSGHSSPSPEFSVSSQTGLRLKIATIRKQSPTGDKTMPKISAHSKSTSKSTSSSSDSSPSSDSDSESEKSERNKKIEVRQEAKPVVLVKEKDNVRQTRRLGAKTRSRVAERKEEKPVKNVKKDGPVSSGSKSANAKIRPKGRKSKKGLDSC